MGSFRPGDPAAVEELFDQIAPRYDQLNDLLSLGLHRLWKRQAVAWLRPRSGQRLLDLCCGTGDLALVLAAKVRPGGEVLGLDAAAAPLARAVRRAAGQPWLPVRWQQADAQATGLPAAHFDGAVMAYGLRNLADPAAGLRELHRLLRPGGRAAVLDFNRLEPGVPLAVDGTDGRNQNDEAGQSGEASESGEADGAVQAGADTWSIDPITYPANDPVASPMKNPIDNPAGCLIKNPVKGLAGDPVNPMGASPGVAARVGVDRQVGDPVRQGGRGVPGAEGPARTLAAFQRLYLRGLVVPVATAAGLREHYAYLEESLACFPTGPEQVQLAQAAGFRQARHRPLAAGLMGLLELVA